MAEENTITFRLTTEGGREAVLTFERAEEGLEDLGDEAENLQGRTGAAGEALEGSADAADDLGDAAESAGRRFDSLSEGAGELGERLRNANFGGAADSLKGIAKSFPVATAAVAGSSVAAAGAGVAYAGAAYQAAGFESAMVEVQKTTGLADERLSQLGEEIQTLAGRLGMGQQELAGIAATAGQLGIEGTENITRFTETVAKLTSVAELSAEEASAQIARIANAFDMPISQAENLGSVLNGLSNTTTAKAGDISNALSRVGSAGASIGLTADEVAALGATLIDTGIGAERAGTSMRNVFIRLQSEAEKLADVAGMTQEEFSSLVQDDALEALRAYLSGLEDIPEAQRAIKIKEIFGQENFQAVQSLSEQLGLMNDNLDRSATLFEEGTSLNEEFAQALDTVSKQWAKLKGNLLGVVTTVGQTALPGLQNLLETVNDLFAGSKELADGVERLESEYDELGSAQDAISTFERLSEKTGLSGQETQDLEDATRLLEKRYPGYISKTNDAGKAVDFYTESLRGAVTRQRQLNRAQKGDNIEQMLQNYQEASKNAKEARKEQRLYNEAVQAWESGGDMSDEAEELTRRVKGLDALRAKLEESGSQARTFEGQMRTAARQLVALYKTADGFDTEALADQLTGTTMKNPWGPFGDVVLGADEAKKKAEELVTYYKEIASPALSQENPDITPNGPPDPSEPDEETIRQAERERRRIRIDAMEEGLEKRLAQIDFQIDKELEAKRRKYAEDAPQVFADIERMLQKQRAKLKEGVLGEFTLPPLKPPEMSEEDLQAAIPDRISGPPVDLAAEVFVTQEDAPDGMFDALKDTDSVEQAQATVQEALDRTRERIDELQAAGRDTSGLEELQSELEGTQDDLNAFAEASDRAEQALVQSFVAVGEGIGEALAGVAEETESLGTSLKLLLGKLMKQIGSLLLAEAVALGVAGNYAKAARLTAAGTALVALGTGVTASAKKNQKEQQEQAGGRRSALPGRAGGGPVEGGRSYIVGEEGPEMVVPRDDGVVLPAQATTAVQEGLRAMRHAGPRGGSGGGGSESAAAMESMREEVEALRKSVEMMEDAADTFTKRRPKARVDAREVRGGLDQVERDDNATFGKTSRGS